MLVDELQLRYAFSAVLTIFYSRPTNLTLHLALGLTCTGAKARDGTKPAKSCCSRQPQQTQLTAQDKANNYSMRGQQL